MTNKVTLYIATHNKTGLKYFGKTVKWLTENDLQENYHGSGTYWKRHLKKHGDDVTMKIYKICSLNEMDDDYVAPIAIEFSEYNNIVESKEWANLIPETGLDGGCTKESAKKGLATKRNTILPNGLDVCQSIGQKSSIYWNTIAENGKTNAQNQIRKNSNYMNTIAENGKTNAQNQGKKLYTYLHTIAENGKTNAQNNAQKGLQTKRENGIFEIVGAKQTIYLNKIAENGKTNAQNNATKMVQTKREQGYYTNGSKNPNARKINIYNDKDELMFECNGNFKKIIKEYNLPNALEKSYRNNSKRIFTTNRIGTIKILKNSNMYQYKNWYAKYVDLT